MADRSHSTMEQRIIGLLLTQQVLVEALVQHDAVGYHQLRETLNDVQGQLDGVADVPAETLAPLKQLIATLEARHSPRPAGQPPHAIDWAAWLKDAAAL